MPESVKNVAATAEPPAEPTQCTKKEILGHALGVLGHDSLYTMWYNWIVPFMTDVLVLPAMFLGALLGVTRIWDGVNDFMMGFLADRTKSRYGRFRPWLLRGGVLFPISVAFSFFVPSDDMVVKMILAAVMYVAVDMTFTAVDIPFWSLPAAMTSNTVERGKIIGFTSTASNAVTGAIGIVMPLALVYFGGTTEWSAYFKIAAIVAVFGVIMYMLCFSMVREHVVPDPKQKLSFKLGLKNIYSNRPLLCLQCCNVIRLLAAIGGGTFNYYYCLYNLGDVRYMSALGVVSTICMIGGAMIFPFISKAIGKKNTMFVLAGTYAAAAFTQYIVGWNNITVIFVVAGISTLSLGCFTVCVNAMMADTMEYGEWKTGQRNEGVITATRCFITKIVMAVSGIFTAFVIGFTGYAPGIAQAANTLDAFHFCKTMLCAGIMLVSFIPMAFYNLSEKRHAEIVAELAERKVAKGNQ